jgi:transcription-repair coupling factor (superfamily II helicase)
VRLRWKAESLGFEKIILKNQALKAYFISSKNEEYYKSDVLGYIFSYIQKHPNQYRIKETKGKLMLTAPNIHSIKEAIEILKSLCGL